MIEDVGRRDFECWRTQHTLEPFAQQAAVWRLRIVGPDPVLISKIDLPRLVFSIEGETLPLPFRDFQWLQHLQWLGSIFVPIHELFVALLQIVEQVLEKRIGLVKVQVEI